MGAPATSGGDAVRIAARRRWVRMFCDDCEVAWRGESSSDCWVCGDAGEVGRLTGSGRLDR